MQDDILEIEDGLGYNEIAQYFAIISSIDKKNFNNFSKLNKLAQIISLCSKSKYESHKDISALQKEIQEYFLHSDSPQLAAYIHEAINTLSQEEIISPTKAKELKELFTLKPKEPKKTIVTDLNFNEKVDHLLEIATTLEENIQSPTTKKRVQDAKDNLNNKSFSLGITGVMNAGKSTLLNALMHSNILGTAVVPETANLSVIKYSKTKGARVDFWNKEQWENIQRSKSSSIEKFVKETKEQFKDSLEEFIQESTKSIDVNIEDLPLYTSAIKSKGKCNLVKSVELRIDLPFLKDGVVIVDTPGLDDPVIQREEITKEYLSSCDLLIHLMNVSQSATKKDIEFIIDALTYQGISQLLIVLTRIDAVSEEELEEVINYTKVSIKQQLEESNKGALFNQIIQRLEFIPVAGKLALMHRTGEGKRAQELGYSEEQTGIFKIENYLNKVLFGQDSPKANLLLNSNSKILLLCTDDTIKSYEDEKTNLGKSSQELRDELSSKEEQNRKKEEQTNILYSHIQSLKDDLKNYSESALQESDQRVNALKNRISERIFSDVKYELTKNNKRPTQQRVSYFIDSGIKDGILDIVRDYRFNFSKKASSSQARLDSILDNENIETKSNFDAKEFFKKSPHSISKNFSILITKSVELIKKTNKNSLDGFSENFDKLLNEEFDTIKKDLKSILKGLNATLIDEFAQKNEDPLSQNKKIMDEELYNLKNQIQLIDKSAKETKDRIKFLNQKIENLQQIKTDIKRLKTL